MTSVKITEADTLCCPKCRNDGDLHQNKVTIYTRELEDGPVTVNAVDGHETVVRPANKRETELAGRRDFLLIGFRCQSCHTALVLRIKQHKGNTFVNWE